MMLRKSESRAEILDRAASGAALVWTGAFFSELQREGRRVEGGWPGTVREARTRAANEATRVLTQGSMAALTGEELDRLARITYEEARKSWREKAK